MQMDNTAGRGKIYLVGLGPGKAGGITLEAKAALEESHVIAAYTVYADLVKKAFPEFGNKEFFTTGMRSEIERCKKCFEFALENKTVSLVCSGDAGVYGMAEPLLSLKKVNPAWQSVSVKVIPGVTAALSGAGLLGAPLNHDFCVISLSDLLTPWSLIEKRLRAAIQADFAIAIYNPSSHKRNDYLSKACSIMIEAGCEMERPCACVQNIGREGEKALYLTMSELKDTRVDMFTTVFIGNSQSRIVKYADGSQSLLTKRGYKKGADDDK